MSKYKGQHIILILTIGTFGGFILGFGLVSIFTNIMEIVELIKVIVPLFTALLTLLSMYLLLTGLEEGRKDREIIIKESEKDRKVLIKIADKEIKVNQISNRLYFYSQMMSLTGGVTDAYTLNKALGRTFFPTKYEMYAGDELKDMLRKYLYEITGKIGGQITKEDDELSLSIKEKVKKEYEQLLKEYRNLTL